MYVHFFSLKMTEMNSCSPPPTVTTVTVRTEVVQLMFCRVPGCLTDGRTALSASGGEM